MGPETAFVDEGVYRLYDGRLEVDVEPPTVRFDRRKVEGVTKTQHLVFSAFARQPDLIKTASQLSAEVLGYDDESAIDSVRVHLASCRRHLAQIDTILGDVRQGVIRTWQRIGYYGVSSMLGRQVPPTEASPRQTLYDGKLVIVPAYWMALINGKPLESLSPAEDKMLSELFRVPGRLVAYESLYERAIVTGFKLQNPAFNPVEQRETVQVTVSSLRNKLGADYLGHTSRGAIETVYNAGYRGRLHLPP